MDTGQARATKRPRTERQLTQEQQAIVNSAGTQKPANHICIVNATAGTHFKTANSANDMYELPNCSSLMDAHKIVLKEKDLLWFSGALLCRMQALVRALQQGTYNTKLVAEAKAVLSATPGIEAVVTKTLNACALELVARYYNRPKNNLIVETPVATLDSIAKMLEVSKLVKSKVPEEIAAECSVLARIIKQTLSYFMHSADARVLDKHVSKKLQEHNDKTGTNYSKADIIYLTQHWFDTAVEAMKSRDQSVLFTHDMSVKLAQLLMKKDRQLVLWYPLGSHSRSGSVGFSHYTHVFIDEAQDVNEAQLSMFFMMNEAERYSSSDDSTQFRPAVMYMIGDPLQSLYQFRGCTNSIEQLIYRLPADERDDYVYTLSNRFGSNIAAVVNTYLQNSMYPAMLSRYEKRMLTSNTYSSTYTNKAVIAPCTDTVVTGAAAYDGIIHSANSSSDNDGNDDLQVPYTILCASNKRVLEAAMSVLNLDDLLSVQSMSQEADSSISSDSQSCNAKVMDTSAMTKQSQHGTQAPAAAFDLDT
eukprot:20800-Heterococcus_DN1.PRE.2